MKVYSTTYELHKYIVASDDIHTSNIELKELCNPTKLQSLLAGLAILDTDLQEYIPDAPHPLRKDIEKGAKIMRSNIADVVKDLERVQKLVEKD